MTLALTFLILAAPFAIAAFLSWAVHRGDPAWRSARADYLAGVAEDTDTYRVRHDADATRTRFETSPSWPGSGATGERR